MKNDLRSFKSINVFKFLSKNENKEMGEKFGLEYNDKRNDSISSSYFLIVLK